MNKPEKISLIAAILININIMLGSGVFINTVVLANSAGALGGAVYVLVGLLLLPLIYAISELMKLQGGTFYEFGELIHPLLGFGMSWSYFIAKLASSALGIHVFITTMQKLFPALAQIPALTCDALFIVFFVLLNTLNLRFGRRIQYAFIGLKAIPLLFIIISAFFALQSNFFVPENLRWEGLIDGIPFVIFAFAGFEASCSLSNTLENPEKNGPRAILISYLLVLAIVTIYQTSFFGLLGPQLGAMLSFRDAYPEVITRLIPSSTTSSYLLTIATLIGIASSSLGASYGIMFSNAWNLHKLASKGHTFFQKTLTSLNPHGIPAACVVIEGIISLCYLLAFQGNQIPLQQLSALGSTIAYTACALVFIMTAQKTHHSKAIAYAGIVSCTTLIIGTIRNGIMFGTTAYLTLTTLIIMGIGMFFLVQLPYFKRHKSANAQ